jgi:hypothetical protein
MPIQIFKIVRLFSSFSSLSHFLFKQDTLGRVDEGTLQHIGDNVNSIADYFQNAPDSAFTPTKV